MENSLIPKRNGSGRISSYTLNISLKEAQQLGINQGFYDTRFITKEIIGNKLVISKAFPQDAEDMSKILEDFNIVGKRLSNKLLLDLLYFIEKDSEAYYNQKNKVYASIRYLGKGWIGYKGQYAFFNFYVKLDKNRVIQSFNHTAPCSIPDFE